MIVVGQDPQFPVRRVDHIFAVLAGAAAISTGSASGRSAGTKRISLVRVVAGGDEDQAAVLRTGHADREADVVGFLVERDRFVERAADAVVAGAIAAPIVVDLGEHHALAVAGPHRLADADLGDRFQVLAAGEIADVELEPLRPVVVDQGRGEAAVGADLERAQAEIVLALGLGRLVEDHLVGAAVDAACDTSCDIARRA